MKYLIINADDFGYSKIFNEEILKLLEGGLITSTTVMIDWVDEKQKEQIKKLIKLSKAHNISIGLHLAFQNDKSFEEEIKRQIDKFISIFGFKPSHLDLHKDTYLQNVYPIIKKFCKENNLPCRNNNIYAEKVLMTNNLVFNGTNNTLSGIQEWVKNLKEDETYEILFHPGKYDVDSKSGLNKEREIDIEKIKKLYPAWADYNVKLISYHDLAKL